LVVLVPFQVVDTYFKDLEVEAALEKGAEVV